MLPKIFFFAWFILLSIPFSMMMGWHQLSLRPSKDHSLLTLTRKNSQASWSILHFVNPECGCSQNVVNALSKRKAKGTAVRETAYILGQNKIWEKELKKAGFAVISGKMDEFAERYKITAVPQLVIIKDTSILYSGGYSTQRGPASLVEDEIIFEEVASKSSSKERPIYGCVNGSENQKKVDLIGIKYRGNL